MSVSNNELIHAYRHLLRHSLRAVQFSYPARLVIQSQLRRAFRPFPGETKTFEPEAIRRTIWFLKAATAERGLEHKILKNVVKVAWCRENEERVGWKTQLQLREQSEMRKTPKIEDTITTTAYEHYEATIAMLNHSMGLCLPVR